MDKALVEKKKQEKLALAQLILHTLQTKTFVTRAELATAIQLNDKIKKDAKLLDSRISAARTYLATKGWVVHNNPAKGYTIAQNLNHLMIESTKAFTKGCSQIKAAQSLLNRSLALALNSNKTLPTDFLINEKLEVHLKLLNTMRDLMATYLKENKEIEIELLPDSPLGKTQLPQSARQ